MIAALPSKHYVYAVIDKAKADALVTVELSRKLARHYIDHLGHFGEEGEETLRVRRAKLTLFES